MEGQEVLDWAIQNYENQPFPKCTLNPTPGRIFPTAIGLSEYIDIFATTMGLSNCKWSFQLKIKQNLSNWVRSFQLQTVLPTSNGSCKLRIFLSNQKLPN